MNRCQLSGKRLRYAFRALGNSPWFAAIAIVTLALGIAVNTSIFSMVNGLLLRPLPVTHPEQLAVLGLQQAGDHSVQKFSYADYVDTSRAILIFCRHGCLPSYTGRALRRQSR